MDMGKPKNHRQRPMNNREAEHHQAGARQGPAVAASRSIPLWCCPPFLTPCKNFPEGENLSKGLIWKIGLLGPNPCICTGRAAPAKHKTRWGLVIQGTADDFTTGSERKSIPVFHVAGNVVLQEGKKEDPLFRWQSKGAESAQPPAGTGPVLVTPPAIGGETWPLKALCLSPAPLYSLEGEA